MKDLGLHKNQQIMMMIIIACYHEFDSKNWRKFKLKFEYILKKTSIHPPTQTHLSIRRIFLAKKNIDHDQKKKSYECGNKKKIEIKSYRLMKTKRKRKIWLTFSTDEKKWRCCEPILFLLLFFFFALSICYYILDIVVVDDNQQKKKTQTQTSDIILDHRDAHTEKKKQ